MWESLPLNHPAVTTENLREEHGANRFPSLLVLLRPGTGRALLYDKSSAFVNYGGSIRQTFLCWIPQLNPRHGRTPLAEPAAALWAHQLDFPRGGRRQLRRACEAAPEVFARMHHCRFPVLLSARVALIPSDSVGISTFQTIARLTANCTAAAHESAAL